MQTELLSAERLISSVIFSITGVGVAVFIISFVLIMFITKQITGIAIRTGPVIMYIIVTALMVFLQFDVILQKSIDVGLVDVSGSESMLNSQIAFIAAAPLTWDLLLGAYWEAGLLSGFLLLLFLFMFVSGFGCMLWVFRSFGAKKGFIAATAGYPIWGLSFPCHSRYFSFVIFKFVSAQFGFILIVSTLGALGLVLYLLYHPLEEVFDAICEDCDTNLPGAPE